MIAIAIAAALVEANFSASAQEQHGQHETGKQDGQKNDAAPTIVRKDGITGFADWVWGWLRRNHEPVVAAFTILIGVFTWSLAVFTKRLWASTDKLIERTDDTTKTIERAYVQMSHVCSQQLPGLRVNGVSGECGVSIGLKNYGTTPGRITRVFLTKRVLASTLPEFPDYQTDPEDLPEQPIEAFLVKDGEIFIGFTFNIDVADIPLIAERKKQLVIYGFVDYTDQFERDFRGGYARNWVPGMEPNNLIFVPHPRYNYDRKRKRGQGNEWA